MDVLYSKWRAKLIGMSTDGENIMTGRHIGVVGCHLLRLARHRLINITFALLQRRSLLLAQQDAHIQALIGSLIAMLNIEIEESIAHTVVMAVDYVIFESMCIDVNQIVAHIEDQGSFTRACYELFEVDA